MGSPGLIRTTLFEPLSLLAFWVAPGPAVGTTPVSHDAGLLKVLVPPIQKESANVAATGTSTSAARVSEVLTRNELSCVLALLLRFDFEILNSWSVP